MIELKFAFVGAGQVNFGGGEGPWNHAKRLEQIDTITQNDKEVKVSISVVGIADAYEDFANKVLENQRKKSLKPEMWKDTKVFSSATTMVETLEKIDAVIVGVPPAAHGTTKSPHNFEMICATKGIHMLIEKPISCYPLDDVDQVAKTLSEAEENGVVISVAYMFRYHSALQKMREIINTHGPVRAFNARYLCAYADIAKEMWWDVERSGGPIVEQGTHFCDLARFIGGEVDLSTLHAVSLKQSDTLGHLSKLPPNIHNLENTLSSDRKVPRVTNAFWKYTSGAIGSLMHGVLLHGQKYEAELEVWGDGYRMVLMEPYTKCQLSVRLSGSDTATVYDFSEEDVYFKEQKAFVEAIVNKNNKEVQSTYKDAFHTYQFSWTIRKMAENS